MALGSSAVAAKAPPIAVALAPCSKIEKPEPNADALAQKTATAIKNPSLLEGRKVNLLSHLNVTR